MKYSGIGGQAVIEGIMMKNGERYAVAVRKPDGQIDVKTEKCKSFSNSHPVLKLPFIRGVFNFVESLILGMSTLMYSASFYEEDEGEPSGFEKKLDRLFGDKAEKVIMVASLILAVLAALVIFMWLPLFVGMLFGKLVDNRTAITLIEGVTRVVIFILYIKIVSKTEDIKRTFMYHGAEHKCINCIEHGLELNPDNVAGSSKEHKRCGTSFIVIVMLISILVFMFVPANTVLERLASRLLLVPVIAGISYEILRLAGRFDNAFINLISKPGLWMQGLTTLEPDKDMIEVGIASVEAVFDWKKYLKDNFGYEADIPSSTETNQILTDNAAR